MMTQILYNPSVASYVGAAFWMFLAIVVVAGIWYSHARNRETQKTLRLAIDKGVRLDAAVIETLIRRGSGDPDDYYIGGLICAAVAIGLPILGYFLELGGRLMEPKPGLAFMFEIMSGVGILVGLIAVSLLASGLLKSRREGRTGRGNPPA